MSFPSVPIDKFNFSFASGTIHKEFTKDDEDYFYNPFPYYKCSPEYGCPVIRWNVDLTNSDDQFECPLFEMPSNETPIIEPCSECETNQDCGSWDTNHMKCVKSKCICGQNWLIGKNRRCNKLNRNGYDS